MTDQMIRDRSFREKMRDRDRITDHEQVIGDPDRIILKLVIPPITVPGVPLAVAVLENLLASSHPLYS